MFGIQYYGECWSGVDAEERYNKYGASESCTGVTLKETNAQCSSTNNTNPCSGKENANYVYKIDYVN